MRWLVVTALCSACSFTPGQLSTDAAEIPVDESMTIDMTVQPGAWGTPTLIAELDSGAGDDDPSLTSDLLEIYWGSRRQGGLGAEDIWVAKRASTAAAWGTPTAVVELNSTVADTTVKVTGDGLAIFFTSRRIGDNPDIFMSTRLNRDLPWNMPTRITELSTQNGDYAPYVQQNQRRVILCSGVNTASEALYVAERASTSDAWGPLMRVLELDETNVSECDPAEPHTRAIYYSSNRFTGTYDLYRASRNNSTDPYGSRTAITELNTGDNDRDPWVSADERVMVFSSDRGGTADKLYISTR